MAPLIVQVVVTLVARIRTGWRDAVRIGLVALILFTAAAHFFMTDQLAAMIPPPFTGAAWVVYLTGVLEIAGAVGLVTRRFRRPAAICLILLLVAMFPANVYAALNEVQLRGRPATPLWIRTPLQVLWIGLLWWSAVRRPAAARASADSA